MSFKALRPILLPWAIGALAMAILLWVSSFIPMPAPPTEILEELFGPVPETSSAAASDSAAAPPRTLFDLLAATFRVSVFKALTDPVALFTGILMVWTWALWRSTKQLADQSKAQSKDIAESIAATRDVALATERVALSSAAQTRALVDIEKPMIVVERFELMREVDSEQMRLNDGQIVETFYLLAFLRNAGRTSATVVAANVGWRIGEAPTTESYDRTPAVLGEVVEAHAQTAREVELRLLPVALTREEAELVRAGTSDLWVFGRFEYTNFMSEREACHFLWKWGERGAVLANSSFSTAPQALVLAGSETSNWIVR